MFPQLAPITRMLILTNVVVYGIEMLFPRAPLAFFALWPLGTEIGGFSTWLMPWQLITYGFLHSPDNFMHILFNMFALFMFGSEIERSMGERKYLVYYFVCVVGAGTAQLGAMAVGLSPPGPVVGASGAVFGILLAYGMAFPHRRLIMLPIPIPIPAWLFVTLYAVLELWLGIFGIGQGVAHFAHLGGAAAGYLLIRYWRRARR